MAAASLEALAGDRGMLIPVVDTGKQLLYLEQMDEIQTGSVEVATESAHTAVVFHEGIAVANPVMLGLHQILPLEGGISLMAGGETRNGTRRSGMGSTKSDVLG